MNEPTTYFDALDLACSMGAYNHQIERTRIMDKTLKHTVKKVARELDTLAEGWRTDDYADIYDWLYDQLEVVPHWEGFAKEYAGAEITVTYGGPTIVVSTLTNGGTVEGSYGSENHTYYLEDATVAAIDEAVRSMAE